VRLWDKKTGSLVNSWYIQEGRVCKVVFLNDREIAWISEDGTVKSWELSRNKIYQWMNEIENGLKKHQHTNKVATVAFSQDGDHTISASDDNTVRESSRETGDSRIILEDKYQYVFSAAYSSNGHQIVIADGDLRLFEYDRQKKVAVPVADSVIRETTKMACSPCGRWIAFGVDAVTLWDLKSGSMKELELEEGEEEEPMMVDVMVFSQDEKRLAVVFNDNSCISFWDTRKSKLDCDENCLDKIQSVAYSSCGTMISIGDFYGTVTLWDLEERCKMLTLKQHWSPITCLAWWPGRLVLSGLPLAQRMVLCLSGGLK